MKTVKPITLAMLLEKRSCKEQVDLFRELFGESVIPTKELATLYGSKFSIDWAAFTLLTTPLLEEYNKARAPLWEEYKKAKPLCGRNIIRQKPYYSYHYGSGWSKPDGRNYRRLNRFWFLSIPYS